MADFIDPFDPSTATIHTFPIQLPNGGWLFIHNESPMELAFKVGLMTSPVLVPAYTARCFQVGLASKSVTWSVLATLISGAAPVSQVYGEVYQPDEWTGGELYVPLGRMGQGQARVINIPMTPFGCYLWAAAVSSGNDAGPFPATVASTNPATDKGCVAYIYSFHVTPRAVVGNLVFSLRLIVRDFSNPSTILTTIDALLGQVSYATNAGKDFAYHPHTPYQVVIARTAWPTMGIVEVTLHDVTSTAAMEFNANLQIDSDKSSVSSATLGPIAVPGIGGGVNSGAYPNAPTF